MNTPQDTVWSERLLCLSLNKEGWRHVTVTERRTKQDFAYQMREVVDHYYATSLQKSRGGNGRGTVLSQSL